MRGKLPTADIFDVINRITPADAGKTLSDVDRDGNKKDHPRGCGENFATSRALALAAGSPPRMRGKLACRA